MNKKTKQMIRVANAAARRGLAVTSIQITTPDGRFWAIDPTKTGTFRLFEIDTEGRDGPNEHKTGDYDDWMFVGDILDYIEEVGQPKPAT